MKRCVGKPKKTQGVFMIKFKVGSDELTHEELLSKVGSGRISHDHYVKLVAARNEEMAKAQVSEKPVIAKAGRRKVKEDANGTESEL